ncbi:phage portal protein [Clostridium sp. 1001275B_160808_H3]|uniref:phage portal protein n=1 Tax=Clostridium sp. 1001275B_160808_H3 TaxID=2787110 RepID=UPI00189B6316|nr:phage portal protein [Clostridium sp. 1001275B_160808_H3]
MKIEVVKKLIKDSLTQHTQFVVKALEGKRYYKGKTDILYKSESEEETNNPLRNADNRISTNWHGLLVNQKVAYMLTYPPTFDIGSDGANKKIQVTLGDEFPKICKDLGIEAANTGVGWLHVWEDENNNFQYAAVDSEQIIPLYSKDLKKSLIAVLRKYSAIDDSGDSFIVYEYWTDKECYSYRQLSGDTIDNLQEYNVFLAINIDTGDEESCNVISHNFNEVPFIPFFNDNIKENDLGKIKKFIDVYDKVFSGFINDIEDIQEIIFILTNYGGTNLKTFLKDLKKYKVVDMQSDGHDEKTGLETLNINIPIEAREKVLEITEKQIYKQGQGVDPNPEFFGNSSGVALEYLYSLLELKCGLAETEFRLGFAKLIRLLCNYLNIKVDTIIQTWTRNKIRNDSELAEIAQKSNGIISKKTVVKNHPWVENPDQEITDIDEEKKESLPFQDKIPLGGGANEK